MLWEFQAILLFADILVPRCGQANGTHQACSVIAYSDA